MIYDKMSFEEKTSLLHDLMEINEKKTIAGKKFFPEKKELIEKTFLINNSFLLDLLEDVMHEEHEFLIKQNTK